MCVASCALCCGLHACSTRAQTASKCSMRGEGPLQQPAWPLIADDAIQGQEVLLGQCSICTPAGRQEGPSETNAERNHGHD